MEMIKGKCATEMELRALQELALRFKEIWIDIGTGDGQFVSKLARANPGALVIGVDAARENLQANSRSAPYNALFVIANALDLPAELNYLANVITINFPWGSLLQGLLKPEPPLLDGLRRISRPGARLEIRLNESALIDAGWTFDEGSAQVARVLSAAGYRVKPVVVLESPDLRKLHSTWAKRMAYGRRPRGVYLSAA